MKKLSCFALVLLFALMATVAFASSPTNVTHEQAATVTAMDTFIISGEPYGADGLSSSAYKDYTAAGARENDAAQLGQYYLLWQSANLNRNKWLVDKKDGFTLYVQRTGAAGNTTVSFDLVARSGLVNTASTFKWDSTKWAALTNKWQNKIINDVTGVASVDLANLNDGFQGFLVRTATDADVHDPMVMPFNLTFVTSGEGLPAVPKHYVRTVMSGDMVVDRNSLCAIDCCAVTFELDCCDETFVSNDVTDQKGYTRHVKLYFNEPNRYGVYCCQDFGIWVTSADRTDATPGNAVFSPDFATAHLNDENMFRVRVAPNERITWNTKNVQGKYTDDSVVKYFWPVEKDLTNTYSRRTAMQDCGLRYDWVQFYAAAPYTGDAAGVKDLDLIDVADNYFGQMQYLGVWYGGANCVCGTDPCAEVEVIDVPRVAIQNLGVDALDIKTSQGGIQANICSSDCGLCDTVSGDPTFRHVYGTGVDYSTQTGYLGTISVDQAYRWGDFNYLSGAANGDIINDQCSCWIYPAFTKTMQPKANKDFKLAANDGTGVTGRWNTAYTVGKLSSSNPDPCCVGDLLFVWQPCDCGEQTNVREAMTAAGCTTTDLRFPGVDTTYLTLDTGIIVTNNTWDMQRIPTDDKSTEALWYNYFKVKDVKYDSTTPKPSMVGVQLRFTLDSADFAAAGFNQDAKTWRGDFWNTFTVIAVLNGQKIDLSSILTKADFDWQGSLFAKVDEIVNSAAGQSARKTNTEITVYLPIFSVNGALCDSLVKYVTIPATGNKIIVANDGVLDGYFKGTFYIAKKGTVPCTITVSDPTLLVGETKTVTPVVAETCACSDVVWGAISSDVASAVVSGDSLIVTGLKVGTVKTSVALKCDETVSKDVTITVTQVVTPTTAPSSSSGGCNAGAFAPLALVLLAPLALLMKK